MEWLRIFFRGMMMGAADIVPGVSGGTIAFITGIYERLISAINNFLPALHRLLKTRAFSTFTKEADLAFLIVLLSGILSSVFLFASLISTAIVEHPISVWSFFFGLILASVWIVQRDIEDWRFVTFSALTVGVVFAFALSKASFLMLPLNAYGVFFSGFIAICAMILPGISGSFILLLLGTYSYIIAAIKGFDLATLAIFASGCGLGLLLAARLIEKALHNYRSATLGFLLGLMIGALDKIWPWKEVLSYRVNSKGSSVPLEQISISPETFEVLTGGSAQLEHAIVFGLIGMVSLLLLGRVINRRV